MLVEEQVDSVQMVECGTKDGITLVFPRIDVHNILPRGKAREMFLRFGHDYDQLTIFKNVKFFTGQICATMTAEEVFLTLLALYVLEELFSDREEEWSLIADKAKKFLKQAGIAKPDSYLNKIEL